jgi:hypothetical protein
MWIPSSPGLGSPGAAGIKAAIRAAAIIQVHNMKRLSAT